MEAKKKKSKSEKDKELLVRVRGRYTKMVDADSENRDLAMEDMRFVNVPGSQWDDNMKQERGARPCYEINKLRVTGKRIINEMRANRPMGKVRGVEGEGDKQTAEIYEGLIRNIWNVSDGDSVIDQAAEYQVNGGMTAWRIDTDYIGDDVFDQDIIISPIHNPYCLWCDPAAKDPMKRDAMDWILTEKMAKEVYEEKYPDADPVSFESDFDDDDDWADEDTIRVAEYWWKEPITKELWQLTDGKVIDSESDEAGLIDQNIIKRRRTVKTHEIRMCVVSGNAVLEQPVVQAGSQHRFIMVYGEYVVVEGRIYWYGIPRFAKDAQRSYNITKTSIAETIAQAPQAKWWATPKQAEGHVDTWAEAHKKNFPFLLYNPDPLNPGNPNRMGGADVPIALIQQAQIDSEDLKAVTGIFSPDLGAGDTAKSGIQERERRLQGQIATYNYQDNMSKGIRRTWEILIDLIPHIYDTERELRVLGSDGAESYVKVNTVVTDGQGNPIKVNDLTTGKYDVTVTVGPSFSTKREEAAETYTRMAEGNEQLMGIAGDLIFKAMDLPYSEDIAERFQALLPPEVQNVINKDAEVPPAARAMMAQADQAMQMVQQQAAQVQQAAMEVEKEKADSEKKKAELKTILATIKTEEAKFEAKIADELAKVAKAQADLQMIQLRLDHQIESTAKDADRDMQTDQAREALANQVNASMQTIVAMTQEFGRQAEEAVNKIQQTELSRPKVVRVEAKREKGKLVAVPVYEAVNK